ncbi:MAG TPA: A/G-specific adenine glycosylase [Dongiaceae bacterium]|nr:A/G-specific adenine glycosylase [Dongiaceae bacterium]
MRIHSTNDNRVRSLLAWFAQNARRLPWRRTRSPYAIWISEIMLQQTQVKTVLPYWQRWMQALPDLGAVARATPEALRKLWEGLGYYTRVHHLQQAARLIMDKYGGRFPEDFDQVLALPGIGRYTAGAICSMAFNQPRAALDGNVMRVLARLFGIEGDPREKATNAKLWQLAQGLMDRAARVTAAGSCSQFSQSLIELGALVCTPRQPRCGVCPVASGCVARRQGRVEELPQAARRVPATPRRFVAFVVRKRGRWLVRQRPAGVVNAHLWEFPNLELAPGNARLLRAARSVLGIEPASIKPLCTVRHSITRYRITLEAFLIERQRGPAPPGAIRGRWLNDRQIAPLPFASAHKKILHHLKREGVKEQARNMPLNQAR